MVFNLHEEGKSEKRRRKTKRDILKLQQLPPSGTPKPHGTPNPMVTTTYVGIRYSVSGVRAGSA